MPKKTSRQATEYINLTALSAGDYRAAIARAAQRLRTGQLVAFPTETVYGLGANGLDKLACQAIYAAKGRPSDNPLILHVADRAGLEKIVARLTPSAEKIIAAFMPGPVTIVLERAAAVPDAVTGGRNTVAVRMPDHPVARDLIKTAGIPIAAPSANLSGRPSPTDAAAVRSDLCGRIAAILDGGPTNIGLESTIIDCTERTPTAIFTDPSERETAIASPREAEKYTAAEQAAYHRFPARPTVTILRPGAITAEMLTAIGLNVIAASPELLAPTQTDIPLAPGLKYTHYAPRAPLTLCQTPDTLCAEYARLTARGETVGLIVSDETAALLSEVPHLFRLAPRGDLAAAAARLYPALRHFDALPVTSLLAETVAEEKLGRAIMNRLRKAAGGRII